DEKKSSCCTPVSNREAPPPPTAPQSTEPPIAPPSTVSTEGMRRLDGGSFLMGTDHPEAWFQDGEGPIREVTVSPFFIDITAVTNAQFQEFVSATGYKTDAEKFGWSYVFHLL